MKIIIAVMLLALVGGCKTIPVNPQDVPAAVVEWIEHNSWKVRTNFGAGSSFWVDKNHLITNCHVVNPYRKIKPESITVESQDRLTVLPAKVVSCDQDHDIAIIHVPETDGFVPMETALYIGEVPRGTRVYSGGFSKGGFLQIMAGFKQGPDPILGPDEKFLGFGHSTHTIMGDSGSALLVYSKGRVMVIGVRSAVSTISMGGFSRQFLTHIALYRPSSHVVQCIDKLGDKNV